MAPLVLGKLGGLDSADYSYVDVASIKSDRPGRLS